MHCDQCGAAIAKDEAIPKQLDDGEMLWFCSAKCFETADLREEEDADRAGV